VDVTLSDPAREARIVATARARWKTSVEMEALVAVSAACLAVYDMAKGIDRGIRIESIFLREKSGGRSGTWTRGPGDDEDGDEPRRRTARR